jgi:hypothetical protein
LTTLITFPLNFLISCTTGKHKMIVYNPHQFLYLHSKEDYTEMENSRDSLLSFMPLCVGMFEMTHLCPGEPQKRKRHSVMSVFF